MSKSSNNKLIPKESHGLSAGTLYRVKMDLLHIGDGLKTGDIFMYLETTKSKISKGWVCHKFLNRKGKVFTRDHPLSIEKFMAFNENAYERIELT